MLGFHSLSEHPLSTTSDTEIPSGFKITVVGLCDALNENTCLQYLVDCCDPYKCEFCSFGTSPSAFIVGISIVGSDVWNDIWFPANTNYELLWGGSCYYSLSGSIPTDNPYSGWTIEYNIVLQLDVGTPTVLVEIAMDIYNSIHQQTAGGFSGDWTQAAVIPTDCTALSGTMTNVFYTQPRGPTITGTPVVEIVEGTPLRLGNKQIKSKIFI